MAPWETWCVFSSSWDGSVPPRSVSTEAWNLEGGLVSRRQSIGRKFSLFASHVIVETVRQTEDRLPRPLVMLACDAFDTLGWLEFHFTPIYLMVSIGICAGLSPREGFENLCLWTCPCARLAIDFKDVFRLSQLELTLDWSVRRRVDVTVRPRPIVLLLLKWCDRNVQNRWGVLFFVVFSIGYAFLVQHLCLASVAHICGRVTVSTLRLCRISPVDLKMINAYILPLMCVVGRYA